MHCFTRSHLSDSSVLQGATTHVGGESSFTAHLLADIDEIDARKLYLLAGYPSLFSYCVGDLHLCGHAALRRIQAARVARRFPAIFPAVAEGRLHLTAVLLLAPYLTEDTAEALLSAATHKTKSEIERLLAARFPKSDMLAWIAPIPTDSPAPSGSPAVGAGACQLAPERVQNGTVPVAPSGRSSAKPLSSQSFAVQFTFGREDHDHLLCAQELLSHEIPSGDLAAVFSLALKALLPQLEKRKFAATDRPRPSHRPLAADSRHVPDDVQRAVWERDGGKCTFVSESGHRCGSRKFVEFDHIEAFARGGEATVDGIRLLCRAHNQFEAERTFGTEFMRHKRIAAAEEQAHELEVVPWLRALGFKPQESRDAAALCRDMPDASLEARVRVALSCFRPRGTRTVRPVHCLGTAASLPGAGATVAGP